MSSILRGSCVRLRVASLLCLGLVLAHGSLLANTVTRSVKSVAGGCEVTLAWEFTGSVDSDLIIEERLPTGWTVDQETVPFGLLDATWFSGSVARFAVKPTVLAKSKSITFTVLSGEGASAGAISGNWMIYLDDTFTKGTVAGVNALPLVASNPDSTESGTMANTTASGATLSVTSNVAAAAVVEKRLSIKSFRILTGGGCELSYSGANTAGTLVVQGCEGLGKTWQDLKRVEISAGDGTGTITLTADELKGCRFMRMKILTEE